MTPRVSIVMPVHNEGNDIVPVLDRLFESVSLECEVLVVVDVPEDTTVDAVLSYPETEPRLRLAVSPPLGVPVGAMAATARGTAHTAGLAAAPILLAIGHLDPDRYVGPGHDATSRW